MQRKALTHDKDGDAHYDVISAFQKSIRGSDVDAALHYLGRLVEAGDLPIICRRLMVIAYEDIGLGNPAAAARTVTAVQAAEKLGFPEARIPLASVVIDLCLSPKSNSAVTAIDAALADIRQGSVGDVPDHLRDAHYAGAKELNRGIGYQYPHNFENGWVNQQYLPDKLKEARYYEPIDIGKYEQALHQQLKRIQEWKQKNNKIIRFQKNNLVADFERVCYYKDGKSVMYALSFHCVDRTFLLISRDPACIKVGNMPFLLVVQYCDRGTHLLILRVQYSRTITGIDGFYHFMKISKQFALASCFLEDKMIRILVLLLAVVTGVASYYLMKKSAAFYHS